MNPKHERCIVGQYVAIRHPREPKVLVMQQRSRIDGKVAWTLPGGKLEVGEGLQEAVEREIVEEAGIPVGDLKLACAEMWESALSGQMKLGLFYTGVAQATGVELSEEHIDFRWCTAEEVRAMEFYKEACKTACLEALEGNI